MASSNVCWGIEIGAAAIKAIKLERDGEGVRVADFAVVPHKRVLTTPDIDTAEAIRLALGAFMAQYRELVRGSRIAVSIPGHMSFARFAQLPPVEPKGVPNVVKFEAVQQIPFPIEEVEWDYQTFAAPDSPDLEVGIFAVTKERVNEQLHLLGDAGLIPDVVTIGPVAAYNAIAYDLSFTEDTPGTVILDIGTQATDLIVADAGRMWIRTFPLGGHAFTEALADAFKLNYVKGEKLKREAETSNYKRHVFQALKPILSDLVGDVQRSINYYQDTHPDAKITRLIGLGSTFKLMGLRKLMSQQLKIEVFRLERYKRIAVDGPAAGDFEAASLNMATAYGLALQGLGLSPVRANLMPIPVIRKGVWKRKTPFFLTAAALGLAAGGVSFLRPFLDSANIPNIGADASINSAKNKASQLKGEWNQISAELKPKFNAQNASLLMGGKQLYDEIIRDLSSIVANANTLGASRNSEALRDGFAVDLRSAVSEYLPPGTSLDADPNRPGRPSSDGSQPEGETAGERGAMRMTLTLWVPTELGKPYMNDSVLQWLREHQDQVGARYSITRIPRIEDVPETRIDRKADSPDPRPPGGNSGNASIDSLAPLPPAPAPFNAKGDVLQYEVRYVLQLREPTTAPADENPSEEASS
ncbi:MAG: type IV pilus assembly protein PilM [Phycisphaeraceae bacterium]|nr:type IV pilus assembly protein PilM [Phycisphaerales bacterium]MCB9841798.1 type IV pilus assembly protein PilM [Phycisphaeraceae bacterium]